MSSLKLLLLDQHYGVTASYSPGGQYVASFLYSRGVEILNLNLGQELSGSALFETTQALLKKTAMVVVILDKEAVLPIYFISKAVSNNLKVLVFTKQPAILTQLQAVTAKNLFAYSYNSFEEITAVLKLFKL